MKSVEQMKQEMEKRLENLEARRRSLESQASSINQRLAQVRQEIGRLTSAIQALDGETPQPPRIIPGKVYDVEEKLKDALAAAMAQTTPAQDPESFRVSGEMMKSSQFDKDLDANIPSERPPAPLGFHWAKNSFGEDSLVKDGVELPPMEEPIVPIKPFPITGVSNDFDDPKDLY